MFFFNIKQLYNGWEKVSRFKTSGAPWARRAYTPEYLPSPKQLRGGRHYSKQAWSPASADESKKPGEEPLRQAFSLKLKRSVSSKYISSGSPEFR
jgi:hypothetical protein